MSAACAARSHSPAAGGVLAAVLLAPCHSAAHHSGLYDEANVIDLEGEIVAVAWRNPHVRVVLDVEEDDGTLTRWELEGTSMNMLERWNVSGSHLPVGARMRARGPRSRFGHNAMIAATAQIDDGETVLLWPSIAARLELGAAGVSAPFPPPSMTLRGASPAGSLFRVWTPRERPLQDPSALPLREPARATAAGYDPLVDDPALSCIPPGLPAMLDTPYPIEFLERGDRIVMRLEEYDGVRTIYMNPAQGPTKQEPSPYGVSFGRWERGGATLAVFTLYIDYPYFDNVGTPQSSAVTVLERYTPSVDGSRLDWEITVTDAATFTTPVVRRGHMVWEPGEAIKPFDCTVPGDLAQH